MCACTCTQTIALRPKLSDPEWIEVLEEELNEYRTLEEEAIDAYDQVNIDGGSGLFPSGSLSG